MPTTQASRTHMVSSATRQVEPTVGALRVVGGTRLADPSPCATALSAPPGAARVRAGEHLFILLDLSGPASPHLYRELRELVTRTYWSASGSITAALRQAAATANRHLLHANLRSTPPDRCTGGLTCAVWHDDDVFILQAGPTQACFFYAQEQHLVCFSRGTDPTPMGTGQLADVRLHHTFVTPSDTLLLASSTLIQEAGEEAISRVLPYPQVPQTLDGLEQIGAGIEFVALVARWVLPPASSHVTPPPEDARAEAPKPREISRRPSPRPQPARHKRPTEPRRAPFPRPRSRPTSVASAQPSRKRTSASAPISKKGTSASTPISKKGTSASTLTKAIGRGVRAIGRGIATVGTGLARAINTVGKGLVRGISTLFRRMLPGQERAARRRTPSRRPIPEENRTVMIALAIGIPVLLAIVVALAYFSFGGEDAHFQRLINQAEQEITLAQTAGGMSQEARPHWKSALDRANAAVERKPGDPVALALQAQARAALDFLDGIVRLQPIQLWDFGPGSAPRHLVAHGQMIFVLDPTEGWVAQLALNPNGDGVIDPGNEPFILQTGQEIEGQRVGKLVGFAWADPGGEQQTSSLLILEEDGALISYDPAWVGEGGTPRFTRSLLGTPPAAPPPSVDAFAGRLYILDPEERQIWRYEPQGTTYPEQPDRYFVTPPPKSLDTAVDIAIDGNIYILYADGTLLKFLQRERKPFDVNGLFDETCQPIALAVDPHSNSGTVYVADQGNGCVVGLGANGVLRARFCAEEAFDALEAVAADEAVGRLYAMSDGRLYTASLP